MHNAVISLGTNRGELQLNLERAIILISSRCGSISKHSSLFKTEPWGLTDQPYFLNQAIEIITPLSPRELLDCLLQIESEMGRLRQVKWEPRLIDLDILFYGNEVIKEEGLTIPHPHLHERRFTLVPLEEIIPGFIHPILQKSMKELLSFSKDDSKVTFLAQG